MRKYAYGAVVGLAMANAAVWPSVLGSGSLRVTFFDVGQGDAIFVETRQGHEILIDGGPDSSVGEKVAQALPFWDNSIDLVLLTHPDADHVTGLVDVLRQYDIENVLWTGVEKDTRVFASWKAALQAEGANVWLVDYAQSIRWSQQPEERLDILYAADEAAQVNDTSVVAKLHYGKHSFLLPGDITSIVEQEMLNKGIPLDADVLKVPHHGSKSSSSENFLAAVSPQIAVIQAGKDNRHGHPHGEVLSRLSPAVLLRTDLYGDILIESNGTYFTTPRN